MTDRNNATPYISDDWLYVNDDTEFQHIAPNFTIHAADTITYCNNFGKFQNHHYSPLHSSSSENTNLDTAFISYAQRLITKFTGNLPLTSHVVQFRYTHTSLTDEPSFLRHMRFYLPENVAIATQPTTSSIFNVDDHTTTHSSTTNTSYTDSLPYLLYNPNIPTPTTTTPSLTQQTVHTHPPVTPYGHYQPLVPNLPVTLHAQKLPPDTTLIDKTRPRQNPLTRQKHHTINAFCVPTLTPWSRTHAGNRFAAFSDTTALHTQTTTDTPSITPTSNISF